MVGITNYAIEQALRKLVYHLTKKTTGFTMFLGGINPLDHNTKQGRKGGGGGGGGGGENIIKV
jgi:hypothetical protein